MILVILSSFFSCLLRWSLNLDADLLKEVMSLFKNIPRSIKVMSSLSCIRNASRALACAAGCFFPGAERISVVILNSLHTAETISQKKQNFLALYSTSKNPFKPVFVVAVGKITSKMYATRFGTFARRVSY